MFFKKSRVIIVTGANRGIGNALINKLVKHPDNPTIVFTSRNVEEGKSVMKTIFTENPNLPISLFYHQLDINSKESQKTFAQWLKFQFGSFDALVNNAAINNRRDVEEDDFKMSPEEINLTNQTNFFSTVELTESLIPLLSSDGRIIMVSSNYGQLLHQGQRVQVLLNSQLTREKLFSLAQEFNEKSKTYDHIQLGYSKPIYKVTKAFLNAYTRWVLPDLLKEDQTCAACHPGWCRTRLGGAEADFSAEEGTASILKLLQSDQKQAKLNNGKYFDEKGDLDSW